MAAWTRIRYLVVAFCSTKLKPKMEERTGHGVEGYSLQASPKPLKRLNFSGRLARYDLQFVSLTELIWSAHLGFLIQGATKRLNHLAKLKISRSQSVIDMLSEVILNKKNNWIIHNCSWKNQHPPCDQNAWKLILRWIAWYHCRPHKVCRMFCLRSIDFLWFSTAFSLISHMLYLMFGCKSKQAGYPPWN